MNSATPIEVTAVFDIGKTNKKLLLFDRNYSVVASESVVLDLSLDDDGDPCEDLTGLKEWIFTRLRRLALQKQYRITRLNVSAYGASLIHLDRSGKEVTPLYDYLKPYPEDFEQEFYERYGGREQFALESASPPMGMLNSGLQLYRLKREKPSLFERIHRSCHFPQYLSSLFTGHTVSEMTSIGCHTAMWDFNRMAYHRWLIEEEVISLQPKIVSASRTESVHLEGLQVRSGVGIHDSSAALLPCLSLFDDPFILLSTGTWSISMNPFASEPLTFDELERDCLCYLGMDGRLIKASRFFLGAEYSYQMERLQKQFGSAAVSQTDPEPALIASMITGGDPGEKLRLGRAHQSGPHPSGRPESWPVGKFRSFRSAYHRLMLDLVSIQADAIRLTEGAGSPDRLLVTGGFAKNRLFVKLLASFFPDKRVYTADMSDASALGAALVIDPSEPDREVLKQKLGLTLQKPFSLNGLSGYSWGPS